MLTDLWKFVMDERHNPLRELPPIVKFQIMTVLAMMWSFIFIAMVGWWALFPHYVIGHMLLLTLGVLITKYTFETSHKISHRDLYRSPDGKHALHDDHWGA